MRIDEDRRFSRAVTRFLEQECVIGAAYSIADEQLFARFRAFWAQVPERFDHGALLGQFRVELAERGFRAEPGGKRPRWLGLTTRGQESQRDRKERELRMVRPCWVSPWMSISHSMSAPCWRHRGPVPA